MLRVWTEYKENFKIIFYVNQDLHQSADQELLLKLNTLDKAKNYINFS